MEVNNNKSSRRDWDRTESDDAGKCLYQGLTCKWPTSVLCECVQITDPKAQRFEVPHEHVKPFQGSQASDTSYEVELKQNPFGLVVKRKSNGRVL